MEGHVEFVDEPSFDRKNFRENLNHPPQNKIDTNFQEKPETKLPSKKTLNTIDVQANPTEEENHEVGNSSPPNEQVKNMNKNKWEEESQESPVLLQRFLVHSKNRIDDLYNEDQQNNLDDSENSDEIMPTPIAGTSDEEEIEDIRQSLRKQKEKIVKEIQDVQKNMAKNNEKKNLENVENIEKKLASLEGELKKINKQNFDLKEKLQKADIVSKSKELMMDDIKNKIAEFKAQIHYLGIKQNIFKFSKKIHDEKLKNLMDFVEEEKKVLLDCDA